MTWVLGRLGSRFAMVFEPHRRRVMHSALGRFHDLPLDLKVGFVRPDGVERVLPFTQDGLPLEHCEQFERFNSITFRGYCPDTGLRYELNVHSPFYPQDQRLCIMPAIYFEVRINPAPEGRWPVSQDQPEKVKTFFRVRRPQTDIQVNVDNPAYPGFDLHYPCPIQPQPDPPDGTTYHHTGPMVDANDRILSLQDDCELLATRDGLVCELPVTEEGSGIKWRMVWGSYVADPIAEIDNGNKTHPGRLLYTDEWDSIDAVMNEAIDTRDDRLAYSRRLEKLVGQMPLQAPQSHLLHQSFQNFLANSNWLRLEDDDADIPLKDDPYAEPGEHVRPTPQWFSVSDGSKGYHAALDVEYNNTLWYLSMWPGLLAMQFDQWTQLTQAHEPSGGVWLRHDLGVAPALGKSAYPHAMPVEESCNFLLMLQAYTRWTGDTIPAKKHLKLTEQLADYLVWTDREDCGFPSEGVANTVADAGPAMQLARKQVYLAIKRVAGLRAAADLLALAAQIDLATRFDSAAETAVRHIEDTAWRGDHYAVCVDESAVGINDPRTGKPLPFDTFEGADAYSIYTANGMVLPYMVGQPSIVDPTRIAEDVLGAFRETLGRYGCSHSSDQPQRVRVSQNLWRDVAARYLGVGLMDICGSYWDLQLAGNTHTQSLGFVDAYMNNDLFFMSRGATAFGLLLAGPLLIVDRLAAGGVYITVNPHRHFAQRWPLFALADWKAGKIPTCVVDSEGKAFIEARIDPVIVQGEREVSSDVPDMIG